MPCNNAAASAERQDHADVFVAAARRGDGAPGTAARVPPAQPYTIGIRTHRCLARAAVSAIRSPPRPNRRAPRIAKFADAASNAAGLGGPFAAAETTGRSTLCLVRTGEALQERRKTLAPPILSQLACLGRRSEAEGTVALHKNKVGDCIFVWTRAKDAPSPGVRTCLISSHGGQAQMNGMGGLPDITLVYYCPNGYILNQREIEDIVRRKVRPAETIAASRSQDYRLTKLQSDPDAETYDDIQGSDRWLGKARAEIKGNIWDSMVAKTSAVKKYGSDSAVVRTWDRAISKSQKDLGRLGGEMDVVTIRNRVFHDPPRLSDVIRDMRKAGYAYDEIHCVFCRCPDTGKSPSYKPREDDGSG